MMAVDGALPGIMPTALSLLADDGIPSMQTKTPGGVGRIVVWLVDGLGYDQLMEALDQGLMPHLARLTKSGAAHYRPIDSVFPSITPVALASLITGTWPGQHGVVGRYIQPGFNVPPLDTLGAGLHEGESPLLGVTLDQRAANMGIHYEVVMEARLLAGTLTKILHPLTDRIVSYVSPLALATRMREALTQSEPGLSYVYWPYLDSINHQRGPYSRDWADEMRSLDGVLASISADFSSASRHSVWLWIVADHGHQVVRQVLPYDALRAAVPGLPERPMGCDRVAGLQLTGDQADAVTRVLPDLYDGNVLIQPTETLVRAGDFGPDVRPGVMSRVGNWILEAGDGCIWDWDLAERMPRANHGGRSSAEMTIPFVEVCLQA